MLQRHLIIWLMVLFLQIAGWISVQAANASLIPVITGPVVACSGSTVYTYSTENGMTGYTWNISAGGTILSGTGTNSVTVQWNLAGEHTISVTYYTATMPGILNVSVTETVVPVVSIEASINPVCSGSQVFFTASPGNGGLSPVYQWKVNGIIVGTNSQTYSYFPANGDHVMVEMTSSATCAMPVTVSSNSIVMTVSPNLAVSISITASSNPVCNGTVVTYLASAVNAGSDPQYSWKVNNIAVGSNIPFFSYSPANNDVITCTLLSSLGCATSNPTSSNAITMTVTPVLPVSVVLSASANPVCSGDAVTITAAVQNAGSNPLYQWKVNGINMGPSAPVLTITPLQRDSITCEVMSSATCTMGETTVSSPLIMTVNPLLPVSVAIGASQNPACQGADVIFSATSLNGGESPVYQWKVNGFDAGSSNPVFQYPPATNDVITCQMTSVVQCPSGSPATSNPVLMEMLPLLPVSVSVSPSQNPVCEGSPVVFTATPVNGGIVPSYQWFVNGIATGSDQTTYSFIPSNNDQVSCVLTSGEPCTMGSPALSNTVSMSVITAVMPAITITASGNPACQGLPVTFTASTVNGGSSPQYQWLINGIPVGTNNNQWTYNPIDGDAITCTFTSGLSCVLANPVTAVPITMTVSPSIPAGISIQASANPVCQGGVVTLSAIPENEGTNPSYQWIVNGISVGGNVPVYSYAPANGDVVMCILTSSLSCASGNPVESDPLVLTVNPLLPVSVTVQESENPTCQGTGITYLATPENGGSSPSYQWHANGIAVGGNSFLYTNIPTNGQVITCTLTSSASCILNSQAISNPVNMVTHPTFLVTVSISASANPVCTGQAVTLMADELNGGISPVYQWYVNGFPVGTNNPVYTYIPADGDMVKCRLTSSINCTFDNPVFSNEIELSVNSGLPVSVSVTPSANPVCQGETVTFTANAVNGGSNPVYSWQLNGSPIGTNSSTLMYTPVNGNSIACEVTSNLVCASSNPALSVPVTMSVNPTTPVSVSVSASENPVCAGVAVTITASPYNGGISPVYQWNINGTPAGSNSPTYVYTPQNGDMVTCGMIPDYLCPSANPALSNTLVLTVSNSLPATIEVSASENPLCSGSEVTLTAVVNNGGASPVFQWQVNGINSGNSQETYTYYPANGDLVNCILTSSASCINGNPFHSDTLQLETMNAMPVDITIDASANPTCEGVFVTFTADPVNGGLTPDYQWQVNGVNTGTNNQSFQYMPASGDAITCILTSSMVCATGNPATSNPVLMVVAGGEPVSITISANPSGVLCDGTEVTFSATTINGGAFPVYQWSVNGVPSGSNLPTFEYMPNQGDIVLCSVNSSTPCALYNPALSNPLTMSVMFPDPVGISIAASANPVCSGTWVTFTATSLNGGASPQYQWTINGNPAGENSPVFTYQPTDNDLITCTLTSGLPCTSNNPATAVPVTMQVENELPVGVSIVALLNPICTGSLIQFTATSVNPGSTPHYQWKVNGQNVGNNHYIYQYFPQNGDEVFCVLTSGLACATGNPAISNMITMVAFPGGPVSVSVETSSASVCQGDTATVTATATNGGVNPIYYWKRNGASVGTNSPVYRFVPANGDVIHCLLLSNAMCATGNPATSNQIQYTVHPPKVVTASIGASATTLCAGNQADFTSSVINGGTDPHYQWRVNGLNTGSDSPTFSYIPVHGDIVSCEVTSTVSCPVINPVMSNAIVLTVSPILPVSISVTAAANPACSGIPVIFSATPQNGGASPVYQWMVNGISAGESGSTFQYTPNNEDTLTCQLTSSAGCTSGNPAVSQPLVMSVSDNFPVTLSISPSMNPACLGQTVLYTALATNAGTSPIYLWSINGINVGPNTPTLSHVPSNSDTISCVVTSSYSCATSNPASAAPIVMEVGSSLPANIQITSSANPVCQGTAVTFFATIGYGGNTPVFQWKVNGTPAGENQSSFTYIPSQSDQITCTLTSSYACASNNPAVSNTITMMVVTPQSSVVTTSPTMNPVCQGSQVTVVASITNGGNNPDYMWYLNGLVTGSNQPFLSYVPSNGDSVWCRVISKNVCSFGDTIISDTSVIDVSTGLVVSLSITALSNPVCQGETAFFTAEPVNGGLTPAYQWSVNGMNVGINASAYSYIPTQGDKIYCEVTSSISCAVNNSSISDTITMSVDPVLPVGVAITPSANPVCENETVTLTAFPVNGGISPVYEWQVNGEVIPGNQSVFTFSPSNNDTVRCRIWSSETCISGNPALSNPVIMIVSTIPVPVSLSITASANPFCAGDMVIFTSTAINGGLTPQYTWLVNQSTAGFGNTLTYIPADEDSVRCMVLSNAACAVGNPALSNLIVVQENPLVPVSVAISATPSGPVCAGSTVTYTALPGNGGSSPSYQWYLNGTSSGVNAPQFSCNPNDGDSVSVTMISSVACPANNPATSEPILASVSPNLPVSVTISSNHPGPVCQGTLVTYTATPVHGGDNPVYQWVVDGSPVGAGGSSLTFPVQEGIQTMCLLTSSETCTSGNPATSNSLTANTFPPTFVDYQACITATSREAKPFPLKGGIPSGGEYVGTGAVNGIFYPTLTAAGTDTVSIFYRYTDMNGCSDSTRQQMIVFPSPGFTCGDLFVDIRDNQSYETMLIGTQCWFRENLNIGQLIPADAIPHDNCTIEKFCYEDDPANCHLEGGLYQWNEAMDYLPVESSQGICPPGWHIPTEGEWMTLFTHFSGMAHAGQQLKSGGESGFNVLLAGVNVQQRSWEFQGFSGFFWASSQRGTTRSLSYGFNVHNDGISTYHSLHSNAFSVRCIRD